MCAAPLGLPSGDISSFDRVGAEMRIALPLVDEYQRQRRTAIPQDAGGYPTSAPLRIHLSARASLTGPVHGDEPVRGPRAPSLGTTSVTWSRRSHEAGGSSG